VIGFRHEDPEILLGEIGPERGKLLLDVLAAEGGRRCEESWSPDFLWIPFQLGDEYVGVIDETWVGISLKGPREVIDRIAARYREAMP
jgi:hypothetical protein